MNDKAMKERYEQTLREVRQLVELNCDDAFLRTSVLRAIDGALDPDERWTTA